MGFLKCIGIFNYGLVLIYGLFLSVKIAGGYESHRQKALIFAMCPVFLLIQTPCWLLLGVDTAKQLYPFIVHLPLTLILIFCLKKPAGVAIVSVCTAYLCCQIPRCFNIVIAGITNSVLTGEIVYTLVIAPIYIFLRRYFVRSANEAITCSRQSFILFGSLPLAYYAFDYATIIYSDILYSGGAIIEILPTIIIVFYVVFMTAYRNQEQKRHQAELQNSRFQSQLKQAEAEMTALRLSEKQSAVYQHDIRHHLNMIGNLLANNKITQAEEYINKVQSDIEAITLKRFCENETVNLLCSYFLNNADKIGARLIFDIDLPKTLSISAPELCSVMSNAIENALNAVKMLEDERRWVRIYCQVRLGKLLIEVKNPYNGAIEMKDGLPVSKSDGHGFGAVSIRAIAERRGGICTFAAKNGIFQLRFMMPIKN